MANIAKLEAVLGQIKAHPEQHDQHVWAEKTDCGTSYCFAGWAVVLEGHEIVWRRNGTADTARVAEVVESDRTVTYFNHIEGLAGEVLELTGKQSAALFDAHNTVDDLERMVKNLANGDPILTGYGES